MKNYININGTQIELTEEQAALIRSSIGIKTKLSDIPVGETFWVGKYEFIVLERFVEGTAVILKDCYKDSLGERKFFGTDNNYVGSNAARVCNAFCDKVADIVGMSNLVEHTVDLTALDGRRDYGEVKSYMSPLTLDRFYRYVDILEKHTFNANCVWWLATPFGTPACYRDKSVCCVVNNKVISDGCNEVGSIRPFCIFKSSMTVSK